MGRGVAVGVAVTVPIGLTEHTKVITPTDTQPSGFRVHVHTIGVVGVVDEFDWSVLVEAEYKVGGVPYYPLVLPCEYIFNVPTIHTLCGLVVDNSEDAALLVDSAVEVFAGYARKRKKGKELMIVPVAYLIKCPTAMAPINSLNKFFLFT